MRVDWNKLQGIRIRQVVDHRLADVLDALADTMAVRPDPVYRSLAADLHSVARDLRNRPDGSGH